MEFDVVVVGSGAGGLTTAFVAAKAGLKVVVLEATDKFGGTTAYSGGGVWVPGSHHQRAIGIDDSIDQARTYLKAVLGNFYDAEKTDAYLATVNEMLGYMEANSDVRLTGTDIPDYEPHLPGWNVGRCHLTADFDGNQLGADFEKVRPHIPETGIFTSMQVAPGDAYRMVHWKDSLSNALFAAGRVASYALDRARGRRGRRMANGNALAGRLFKSARDAGVTLQNNSRVRELVVENGRVTGVVVDRNGGTETIGAQRAVVLASGGFGANEELRRKFMPQSQAGWSLQPEGNQGDGVAMGVKAGAVLNESNASNGIWVPASSFTRPDGTLAKFPSLCFDRHSPGTIVVDARNGKRFMDESFHYQAFGEITLEKGITKVWMISDTDSVNKYGMGMIKPKPFSPKPWVKKGYVKEAATIGELAVQIGLDPAVLEETVAEFNRHAAEGKDPEFKRGENAYSAYMGDPTHRPNTALGPIVKAPFYALELRPSDLSSLAGLNTNSKSQVLDGEGKPIPGLYAAGLDNNTMLRGRYPGGGGSLRPAMTFGYIAARHIAGIA